MPPSIALFITIIGIIFLLLYDYKKIDKLSIGIWIPVLWFLIIGSRPVASWFDPVETEIAFAFEEGSAVNQAVDIFIILFSAIILYKRNISIYNIVMRNKYIIIFYLFCGVSVLWSDYRFVSFKRWIKSIENVMVILIILTEFDPMTGLNAVIRRCSYILIPLSICLIKYFPGIGRDYNFWTGGVINRGAAVDKNGLGRMCLAFGLVYIWNLFYEFRNKDNFRNKIDSIIHIGILCGIIGLLIISNSATSIICFIIGTLILVIFKIPVINNKVNNFGVFFIASMLFFISMDYLFNIKEIIITMLGRNMTLTERDVLWKVLLGMHTNTWVGTGFESFWMGERLVYIKNVMGWIPNEAHNGYLEVYLNLGIIGLILFTPIILFSNKIIIRKFKENVKFKILGMVFLVVLLFYNITEAAFKGANLIWNIFLFMVIDYQITEFAKSASKYVTGTSSE